MAPKRSFKGVSRKQRVRVQSRRDDTRRFGAKFKDKTTTESGTISIFAVLLIGSFFLSWAPFVPELLFLASLAIFFGYYRFKGKMWDMPFRVPGYLSKRMGFEVRDATTQKKGRANLYMGMDQETEEEVWADTGDINKHVLAIGTTGSGKTELLMGHVLGLLARGSGSLVVDGKASVNTYDSMYKIARLLGREVDLFAMDYLTGGKDVVGPQKDRRSHTYNPLGFGGSAQKSEVMNSLLDGTEDIWMARAIAFIEGMIPPLSYLAERGYVLLNPVLLGRFFVLENVENLIWHGVFTDLNGRVVNLKSDSPAEWMELQERCGAIRLYVENLPSYSMCRPKKPVAVPEMDEALFAAMMESLENAKSEDDGGDSTARQEVTRQHGFITMQLVRAINNLSFNYGYIYGAEVGEIDYEDVVLNRRSLIVLLPALERGESNLEQLGKLTVLSLKAVLGSMLNTRSEGTRREIIDGNPSNSKIPFGAILDEVGQYMVTGMAAIPAQARSLGVAMYFGTQAIPDLMKKSEHEGKAILDNTALKFFGRVTSDTESQTAQTAINMGGQAYVQMADNMHFERDRVLGGGRFKVADTSSLQQQFNVSYDDLTQQENGEFHLIVGAKETEGSKDQISGGQRVVRMLAFFTGNVEAVSDWRRNPFVVVKPPSRGDLAKIREAERIARQLNRSVQDVLSEPSENVMTAARAAEKTLFGKFLKWREQEIEAGRWPRETELRERKVSDWLHDVSEQAKIEDSIKATLKCRDDQVEMLRWLTANDGCESSMDLLEEITTEWFDRSVEATLRRAGLSFDVNEMEADEVTRAVLSTTQESVGKVLEAAV
tara:strand:+ start:995 stop:3481 length:2487 start_codon:yes stop_codon:yes gene_type:complete